MNKELERQIKEGELVPVEKSEWAAPLVIVRKSGGSVRICADYKVTVNPSVKEQAYRLPTAEEIFSTLAHGEWFSKLDLANAYKQLPLVPDSQAVLTMNTPLGLLMPTRLPFGLKVSPNLWQRTMDDVLKGLTGVACYLDDLLVIQIGERIGRRNRQRGAQGEPGGGHAATAGVRPTSQAREVRALP